MNHNFVSFELTQLLPIKNEFGNLHKELNEYFWSYSSSEHRKNKDTSNAYITRRRHFNYIRVAYTWEDIRLYLLSKGYEYNVTTWSNYLDFPEVIKNRYSVSYVTITGKRTLAPEQEWFDNYEVAREYIITEILKLINKKNDNL